MFANLTTIRPKTAFLINCFFLLLQTGCATSQSKPVKNEFGLEVLNTQKMYWANIASVPSSKMVALANHLKPFYSDIRYGTINNFTHHILYQGPSLYLRQEAADKLTKVQDSLLKLGFNLLLYDAYRPYSVTKKMWAIVPDDRYAANPATGSGHNRGIAVDLTLTDANGVPVAMPTGYDNFSDTAHHTFLQLPATVLQNRGLLKSVMEHFGFKALSTEWWHFSLPEPKRYALLDLDFKQMKAIVK